jgi:hypothetical protein
VVIASDDHCPPHVHARHKEQGWVVRLWFSFETEAVGVMSIVPSENVVRQRQLNLMLDELVANSRKLRTVWWEGKMTTCLENKWMMRIPSGRLAPLNGRHPGAKQVRFAEYDVKTGKTTVTFADGYEYDIESGDEK